jgi:hypothetical protein
MRPPVLPPPTTVVFFNKKIKNTQQSTNDDDNLHRLRNTLPNAIAIKAQCRMLHLGIANTAINNFLIDNFFFLIRCCLLSCSLFFNILYIKTRTPTVQYFQGPLQPLWSWLNVKLCMQDSGKPYMCIIYFGNPETESWRKSEI